MLRSIQKLRGFKLQARDGEIGEVEQVFFDDEKWTLRYFVVKTGHWLLGRSVLISPISVDAVKWDQRLIIVSLSQMQVQESPDIDSAQPVSRQMEQNYYNYYRWPYYWTGAGIWGSGAYPAILSGMDASGFGSGVLLNQHDSLQQNIRADERNDDTHLRSSKEVIGYKVEAIDATFGHVEDLILEDDSWKIRYLVIDTISYWPSKSVLLPPDWVDSVSWSGQKIRVNVPEHIIKQAPNCDLTRPIDRDFERRLFGYYGRPGYWKEEDHQQDRRVG